jgi:enamine deaminase RidA (YjgF/YER057c/UK114 family)
MMRIQTIQPPSWAQPKGYANGVLVKDPSRFVYTAGQIAWDSEQNLVGLGDFVAQFRQALSNVLVIVRQAGGQPQHLVRLTIYVSDKDAYLSTAKELGTVYRELMEGHYPAMALVQVAALLEEGAMIEIEGTAALP